MRFLTTLFRGRFECGTDHQTHRSICRLFASVCATVLLGAPAFAFTAEADYVLSVSGNIVAQIQVDLTDDGSTYDIDLDAAVAGLGRFVASGSAHADVTGAVNANGYFGNQFSLDTRTSEGQVTDNVTITGGNVTAFTIVPPLPPRYDLVPIERSQLRGVNDGLSAFILKGTGLNNQLCSRTLKVFTGFERFDLRMSFAGNENATSARTGYQGPVALCQVEYRPISGHYETSEITNYLKDHSRILIWYAPLGETGTYIPYRVLVGTAIGDLSLVLTKVEIN